MSYTVKQLAELSGVSVRTLHYYDEIDLLKPAYTGDNQYRYYEAEQLLLLQQILFYKELGFGLNDIKDILYAKQFDKIQALESHRHSLTGDLERVKTLIKTIDKTLKYLRGTQMVKLEEIFEGFTDEKQKLYEEFLVTSGVSEAEIETVKSKVKHWSKEQWMQNKQDNDAICHALVQAIEKGLSPDSQPVQVLIQKHYDLVRVFWTPDKNKYIGLSELYGSNPDFVAFYKDMHPKLLEFLQQAMTSFARKNLS